MVQHVTMNDGQVLELENDEIATLIKEAQNDGSSSYRPRIVVAKAASSPLYRQSWCWAMTFLLAAIVILLTTDSLQVHISLRGIQQHSIPKSSYSDNHQVDNNHNEEKEATTTASSTTNTVLKSPAAYPILYRGPKVDNDHIKELAAQWGQWSLTDDSISRRPTLDCGTFSHCDILRTSFPPRAWQTDAAFLESFLTQGLELVTRAQEAVLAEYGHSKNDQPNLSLQERSAMFQLTMLDLKSGKERLPGKKDKVDNGGWTTSSSFKGLVRRVLHAIVTQDTFTFAMGGHSSATGHGNYFKQSYTMQFHKVMEPVFARLGVTLHSHNMAQGGLGTIQNSMAMGSLYGNEIDFCMWDSGMTESASAHYDVFARQALISGNRVPILWGGLGDVLLALHKQADVDIGAMGTGMKGIMVTESEEQAALIPYAARYLNCERDVKDVCEENKYNAVCWMDRPDVKPWTPQDKFVGGRAGWHPGFRTHQLQGRILAFTVLIALQEALQQWKDSEDYALPDSAWHVTEHYQNIRDKLDALKTTPGYTDKAANLPTTRICNTALKGVSEFTPRFRPAQTSIRSIMKDPSAIAAAPSNIYTGPDIDNPALETPENTINYLSIVENDVTRSQKPLARQLVVAESATPNNKVNNLPVSLDAFAVEPLLSDNMESAHQRSLVSDSSRSLVVQGRGWSLDTKAGDIHCNGTWDSECGRGAHDRCLLAGHNDGRGGLLFDSLSGWLVLNLKRVKEGIIIIKFESWHGSGANPRTEGWTAENNNNGGVNKRGRRRRLGDANAYESSHRELKSSAPDLCDDFVLEYAMDGDVHSLTKNEFLAKRVMVQRVVETLTLLDEPSYVATVNKDGIDVELAIRMRGCQRTTTFSLTHVYWA